MPRAVAIIRLTFGALLRRYRKEAGFSTQKALADKLGVSLTMVNRWECGHEVPHEKILDKLVNALKLLGRQEVEFRAAVRSPEAQVPQDDVLGSAPTYDSVLALLDDHLLAAFPALSSGNIGNKALETLARALGSPDPQGSVVRLLLNNAVESEFEPEPGQPDVPVMPEGTDRARLQIADEAYDRVAELYMLWPASTRDGILRALATYFADYAPTVQTEFLAPDEQNITAALSWALENDEKRHTVSLASALCPLLRDRGKSKKTYELLTPVMLTVEAVNAGGDSYSPQVHLRAYQLLSVSGQLLHHQGDLEAARGILERAAKSLEDLDFQFERGTVLSHLARVLEDLGELDEAEDRVKLALRLHSTELDRAGIREQGVDCSSYARIRMTRGYLEEADRIKRHNSLPRRRTAEHRHRGEAIDWRDLGSIALRCGRFDEAERYFNRSLAISTQANGQLDTNHTISEKGCLAEFRGRPDIAKDLYEEALREASEINDQCGVCLHRARLAALAAHTGDLGGAVESLRRALDEAKTMRHKPYKAMISYELGTVLIKLQTKAEVEEGRALCGEAIGEFTTMKILNNGGHLLPSGHFMRPDLVAQRRARVSL